MPDLTHEGFPGVNPDTYRYPGTFRTVVAGFPEQLDGSFDCYPLVIRSDITGQKQGDDLVPHQAIDPGIGLDQDAGGGGKKAADQAAEVGRAHLLS
jgi:hypothetical protein